jgi:hypothetical protein
MARRFPFILRSDHDFHMEAMRINLQSREDLIAILRRVLAEREHTISTQEASIESLTKLLTDSKCNDYTPKDPQKGLEPFSHSRGGWRGKAEAMSSATFPKPKDSVAQLEERVRQQGGKTDAV